jgi:hypothetical protein
MRGYGRFATSANIARLIGSGSIGHAATIRARSGSGSAVDATNCRLSVQAGVQAGCSTLRKSFAESGLAASSEETFNPHE